MSGSRPFAYQSGELDVGAVGEIPLASFGRLIGGDPFRPTRAVMGWLTPAGAQLRVEFVSDQPLDPAQREAVEHLQRWAASEGVDLQLPVNARASFKCAVCGSAVIDWVCADLGIGGSCGFITCPICADGSGGSNTADLPTCRHYTATLPGDLEAAAGPLLENVWSNPLPAFPNVPSDELEDALGERLQLAREVYREGFDQEASVVRLYEALVRRHGGHVLESSMDSGGAVGGWSWRDVFVANPQEFERELRDIHALLHQTAERFR